MELSVCYISLWFLIILCVAFSRKDGGGKLQQKDVYHVFLKLFCEAFSLNSSGLFFGISPLHSKTTQLATLNPDCCSVVTLILSHLWFSANKNLLGQMWVLSDPSSSLPAYHQFETCFVNSKKNPKIWGPGNS